MIRVDGRGDSSSLIQVRGLNKTYSRGGEQIQVLQGLNLDVDKGDFVAFMGPSGSGKTTLLNLLGGLDVPSAGSITVDGDEITHMSAGKLTHWRARHVGFIFQMYNLIPVLTAFQNVELPLLLTKLSKSERRKHVLHAGELDTRTAGGPSARDLELVELEPVLVGDASRLAPADQPLGGGGVGLFGLQDPSGGQVLHHARHGLGGVGLVGADDAGGAPLDPAGRVLAHHGLLGVGVEDAALLVRITPQLSWNGTPGTGTPR